MKGSGGEMQEGALAQASPALLLGEPPWRSEGWSPGPATQEGRELL